MTDNLSSTVTVYQSGNSKVITIPSYLPVAIGQKYELKYMKQELILKKKRKVDKNQKIRKLHSMLSQAPNSTKNMDIEELENFLEGIYG